MTAATMRIERRRTPNCIGVLVLLPQWAVRCTAECEHQERQHEHSLGDDTCGKAAHWHLPYVVMHGELMQYWQPWALS